MGSPQHFTVMKLDPRVTAPLPSAVPPFLGDRLLPEVTAFPSECTSLIGLTEAQKGDAAGGGEEPPGTSVP